jgi:excisionase family DNA binding protein
MAHRGRNPDSHLLTIKEVAAVLRMKPDTIYRWARRGRLGAVKLGKEWRIPATELEAMIGRPVSRPASPASVPAPSIAPAQPPATADGGDTIERRLQAFIVPRDHLLAVAGDEDSLDELQGAFWRLAALSGGHLVITRSERTADRAERNLASQGLAGSGTVVAVADDTGAREAVLAEVRPGQPVWACYGLLDELGSASARIESHARMVAAAALTSDVISLSAVTAASFDRLDFDVRLRIESHHRALIHLSPAGAVLARIR